MAEYIGDAWTYAYITYIVLRITTSPRRRQWYERLTACVYRWCLLVCIVLYCTNYAYAASAATNVQER